MDKLPELSVDLIAELDKLFPARAPSMDDPERLVWWKAGQREVVEILIAMKNKKRPRGRLNLAVRETPEDDEEEDANV